MKRTIRRARQVKDDIVKLYGYIHARSPQAAERVLNGIEQSIRSLLDAPGVGRYWNSPDSRLQGMKMTPVTRYRNYLIFFRDTGEHIEVFRVVHGARELNRVVDEMDFDFEDE